MIARLGYSLLSLLPSNNEKIYQFCKLYIDRYNSDNDSNIHTNGELNLLIKILENNHVVFDVGANKGDWSSIAIGLYPNITLHCFEPSFVSYQLLISQNFPPNVIINNFGLGSSIGESNLYAYNNESGMNSLYQRIGLENGWGIAPQSNIEKIHLDTLDRYCYNQNVKSIDFIKIDVEGHELEVLKGASNMLINKQIKIIQFEYGGCYIDAGILLKDIFEFLQPYGYQLNKIYPNQLKFFKRYDQRLENFQYQNWVAILQDCD